MTSQNEIKYWQFHDCIRNNMKKTFVSLEERDIDIVTNSITKWWRHPNEYSEEGIEMIADNSFERMKLNANQNSAKEFIWIPKDGAIEYMKKDIIECLRQNDLL
jgi:hypothetical protein